MFEAIDHQLDNFVFFLTFVALGSGLGLRKMFGPDALRRLGGYLTSDAGKGVGKSILERVLKGR
jgi:hypothetical protein